LARRNSLCSWLTASVLMFSGMAGMLWPSPAGAADEVVVWVHPTFFEMEKSPNPSQPNIVYAKPYQTIIFRLVDPTDRHHSVTVDPAECTGKPSVLCDRAFDDPNVKHDEANNPVITYSWSKEKDYPFSDRYAPESGREMTGIFRVSSAPPTVQPAPPAPTTTTTMAPATTTTMAPTTTTTAPTSIRPLLISDSPPTTATTRAANPVTSPTTAPAGKSNDKDKVKKAASPSTPTTAAPGPDGTMPPDSVFDPAALTPAPTLMPAPEGDSGDEAAIDASAAASLLDPEKSGDDGSKLMLTALGGLAVLLLLGGGWGWFNRASQYDPA